MAISCTSVVPSRLLFDATVSALDVGNCGGLFEACVFVIRETVADAYYQPTWRPGTFAELRQFGRS